MSHNAQQIADVVFVVLGTIVAITSTTTLGLVIGTFGAIASGIAIYYRQNIQRTI